LAGCANNIFDPNNMQVCRTIEAKEHTPAELLTPKSTHRLLNWKPGTVEKCAVVV